MDKYCIEDRSILRYSNKYFRTMRMAKKLSITRGTVYVWNMQKKRVIRTYRWGKRL